MPLARRPRFEYWFSLGLDFKPLTLRKTNWLLELDSSGNISLVGGDLPSVALQLVIGMWLQI